MRRTLVALLTVLAFPASAAAAPVLVLGHHGGVTVRSDPFVRGPAVTPAPASAALVHRARASTVLVHRARASTVLVHRARGRRRRPQPVTVVSALGRLRRRGSLSGTDYRRYLGQFRGALATERRLRGTRRAELSAVTETMHQIAASGQLTAGRLPVLFATLQANLRWWTTGTLLAPYQRVEFAGSQLVWEYYPGDGIELQVLGSFGKANGLYSAGRSHYAALEQLLSEIIPLGVRRGGGMTWEYYFPFDGGAPPWTSAMSQATGLQALAHAYMATDNPYYLNVGARALSIFTVPPPVGVAERTPAGTRFLQYSFAPGTDIINAFLQTLIGLQTFAQASGNPEAAQLYSAGNAQAVAELPSFDTGAWSLYQPGVEDDLSYHELVTGFLGQLCASTQTPVYCTTEQHFQAYVTTPPVVVQLTRRAVARRAVALRFRLSKLSHVGVVVTRGSRTVFATSAHFGYGVQSFTVPASALSRAGAYGVRLAATGPAGNFSRAQGTLQVRGVPRHGARRARQHT